MPTQSINIRVPLRKSVGRTGKGKVRLPSPSAGAHSDKSQTIITDTTATNDKDMGGGAEDLGSGGHQDPNVGDTALLEQQDWRAQFAALAARLAVSEGRVEGLQLTVVQLQGEVAALREELAIYRGPVQEVQQFVSEQKTTAVLVTAHADMSISQVVEACAFAAQVPAGALQVTLVAPVGKPFTVDCKVGADGCLVGAVVAGSVSGMPVGGGAASGVAAGPGQSQGGASGSPLPGPVSATARYPPGATYQAQRQLYKVELPCTQGHRALDGAFRLAGHPAFSGMYINEDLPLELRQERRAILADPSFQQEKEGLKGDGKVLRWRQGMPWWKLRRDPDTPTHLHMFAITKARQARRLAATTETYPSPPAQEVHTALPASIPSPSPGARAPPSSRPDGASTSGTRPPPSKVPLPTAL